MQGWLEKARIMSRLTERDCASRLACPVSAYMRYEQHPGTLTLNQVSALCFMFSDEARQLVARALADAACVPGEADHLAEIMARSLNLNHDSMN